MGRNRMMMLGLVRRHFSGPKVPYAQPWFRKLLGIESKKSIVSDKTLVMLNVCMERLEKDDDLRAAVRHYNKSDMYAWFQSTTLHIWLCLGRMYTPAIENREVMSQEMSDHFFSQVEDQLLAQGITNPLAF